MRCLRCALNREASSGSVLLEQLPHTGGRELQRRRMAVLLDSVVATVQALRFELWLDGSTATPPTEPDLLDSGVPLSQERRSATQPSSK